MSNSSTKPVLPLVAGNSGRWIGNDGTWSAFDVHVGTPAQPFYVLPSINGQTIYVPLDLDCERYNVTDCGTSRGVEVFQSRVSTGFQTNASSTWSEIGIYPVGIGGNFGVTGNGKLGYDTAGLGTGASTNNVELKKHAVSGYAAPNPWVGQLGLSQFSMNASSTETPHSFLSRLKEEGRIPSLSFGYQAGAYHRYTHVPGSLVLGGYDRSRSSLPSLVIPSTIDIIVGLQNIATTFPNGTSSTLLTSGILSTIDTAVHELWLPPSVCDAFASAFGLTYNASADRYTVSNAAYASLQASPPNITFTIGSSIYGGQTIPIQIPYAAFDLQAKYPIFPSSTRYFPLRRAANESQYALGRAFMQEIYLTVDWERDVFNISQAVFNSPMPASNIVTIKPKNSTDLTPVDPENPGKSLSTGAIVGIAIGGAAILLLIVAAWWFWRRRQRKADAKTASVPLVDEKADAGDLAPEAVSSQAGNGKPGVAVTQTDLELEGREVPEMYAPFPEQKSYGEYSELQGNARQMAEAEGSAAVYELPSVEHARRDA